MNKIAFALLAVLLIAGQGITPAIASADAAVPAAIPNAPVLASTCGDTYTVQRGDYLTLIARLCNVPYSNILAYNPQITNPNIIYIGQVIRLVAGSTIPVTGGTYVVKLGDTLFKIAVRFGTTVDAILLVNPIITNRSIIYVGQVINLPSGVTSGGTGTARVTVSTVSVARGGSVTVTVSGFPANAELDYRIGKQGAGYTAVVDGKTNASGYATATVTIPSSAVVGEKWVVVVMTTSIKNGVTGTSAAITIK
jgi:LysM repeat protein